jgi:hypothetical protein
MIRHPVSAFLCLGVLSLDACAPHAYAPGPGMSAAQLGPDSAYCRTVARNSRPDTSFEAYGRPRDVAIAAAAAVIVGGIGTAINDSQTIDDCMQMRGWQIADATATGPAQPQSAVSAVPLPVESTPLAPVQPIVYDERMEQMVRAQAAAEAWLIAEHTLNEPGAKSKQRDLYTFLCQAGDRSACTMSVALNRSSH